MWECLLSIITAEMVQRCPARVATNTRRWQSIRRTPVSRIEVQWPQPGSRRRNDWWGPVWRVSLWATRIWVPKPAQRHPLRNRGHVHRYPPRRWWGVPAIWRNTKTLPQSELRFIIIEETAQINPSVPPSLWFTLLYATWFPTRDMVWRTFSFKVRILSPSRLGTELVVGDGQSYPLLFAGTVRKE